jgi:hypothetical protein
MPEVKMYVCENCGQQSTLVDHWLIAERGEGAFSVYTWEMGMKLADKRGYYCGQSCLLVALVEHLQQHSIPSRKPRIVPLSHRQASKAS